MQTRRRSFYESLVVTVVGMGYAIPLNYVMVTQIVWTNFWLYAVVNTVIFTILAVAMKYVFRRFFNWLDIAYPHGVRIKLPEGIRSFILRFYP